MLGLLLIMDRQSFGINPGVTSNGFNLFYVSQQPTFDHEMTGLEILITSQVCMVYPKRSPTTGR